MSDRLKILVVDDDEVIRVLFKRFLEQAGAEVLLAADGETAISIASEEKLDVVIVDGLIPKMHGFLVCKAIKDRDARTKVIIVTGIYTKLTYRWEVKVQYQADDLLQKPIAPAELIACIERHLPGRLTANRETSSSDKGQIRPSHETSASNSAPTASKGIGSVKRLVNF